MSIKTDNSYQALIEAEKAPVKKTTEAPAKKPARKSSKKGK